MSPGGRRKAARGASHEASRADQICCAGCGQPIAPADWDWTIVLDAYGVIYLTCLLELDDIIFGYS